MKYIKTYEYLKLDYEDKQLLMKHALEKNKKELIISLFEDGYDPNDIIDNNHILIQYAYNINYSKFNTDIFNLIINKGANVNWKNKYGESIIQELLYLYSKKHTNTLQYFNAIEEIIKEGAIMINKDNDFFSFIDNYYEKNHYSKNLYDNLITMFKRIIPEQYQQHIDEIAAKEASEKYNI